MMENSMSKVRKHQLIKIFILIVLSLFLVFVGLYFPIWPSTTKLCVQLTDHISKDECMNQPNRGAILIQAFPNGITSINDVRSALGEYLYQDYPVPIGHIDIYRLSFTPMQYLGGLVETYIFTFDNKGMLISITHNE